MSTLINMDGFRVIEIPMSHSASQSSEWRCGVWNRLGKSSADLPAVRWMKKGIIRSEIPETVN